MAFNRSNAQRNTNATEGFTDWKAQGYLNLYLPSKDGGRRKLAGIPLRDSKDNEATLRAWVEADPTRVAMILSKLVMEYQPATQSEGSGFDLA